MVHLQDALWEVYEDEGLTILGVDIMEAPPLVSSWIELKGLTYPIVIAPIPDIYLLFSSGPFPYNAVIDRDGVLRHSSYGFDLPQIESLVIELLDEDPAPAASSSWTELKALY